MSIAMLEFHEKITSGTYVQRLYQTDILNNERNALRSGFSITHAKDVINTGYASSMNLLGLGISGDNPLLSRIPVITSIAMLSGTFSQWSNVHCQNA